VKGFVPLDVESTVSEIHFAIVYVPRKSRKRFSEGCVTIVADEATALAQSDTANKYYPAKVIGPSKSSEGQTIYYLVEWLEER